MIEEIKNNLKMDQKDDIELFGIESPNEIHKKNTLSSNLFYNMDNTTSRKTVLKNTLKKEIITFIFSKINEERRNARRKKAGESIETEWMGGRRRKKTKKKAPSKSSNKTHKLKMKKIIKQKTKNNRKKINNNKTKKKEKNIRHILKEIYG